MPVQILVMGVSGSGKTTIGRALAAALAVRFIEGDDFHPPANRAKMASGQPLDDDDRRGWLEALARCLGQAHESGDSVVLACSALKHAYRRLLAAQCPGLRLVWLRGSRPLIAARLAARRGHFMPAALLDSQMEALEPPEDAVILAIDQPPDEMVAALVRVIR